MRIAILLLIHSKPDIAARLIRVFLSDPDFAIFVHVDKKAESVYLKLKEAFKNETRVRFCSQRYKIYWGNISIVHAEIALLKEAMAYGKFDYFTLMSGQDFPIKPLSLFKQFLKDNYGKDFLSYFKLPNKDIFAWRNLERLECAWIPYKIRKPKFIFYLTGAINYTSAFLQRMFGLCKKLKGEYYTGSNWFTLSKSAISYLLDQIGSKPEILNRFKYSMCSDEFFINSIVLNSPHKENVVNNNLLYIVWPSTVASSPKTLTLEDYDGIISAKDKFFARKFDDSIDSEVVKKIIEHIKQ